jgi:hypothetical protein
MPTYLDTEPREIDANTADVQWWSVGDKTIGSFHVEPQDATAWGTAVLEVVRTNWPLSGVFNSMPSAVTLTAQGMTASLDVAPFAFVGLRVTTVEGSALKLHAWGYFA